MLKIKKSQKKCENKRLQIGENRKRKRKIEKKRRRVEAASWRARAKQQSRINFRYEIYYANDAAGFSDRLHKGFRHSYTVGLLDGLEEEKRACVSRIRAKARVFKDLGE